MALVKCPECGKEVSSQLRKCNNCGYKLKRIDKKKRNVFIVIFCVIIMLTIVGFILLHNTRVVVLQLPFLLFNFFLCLLEVLVHP